MGELAEKKMKNNILLGLVLTIGLTNVSVAHHLGADNPSKAQYSQGLKSFKSGDHDMAIKKWKPLAEQGHLLSQMRLGLMYDKGNGVVENNETAVYYYKMASDQEFPDAQYILARMFFKGEGVKKDRQQAILLLNNSADNGFKEAKQALKRLRK